MPSKKNQAETSLSDLALTELGDRLPGLISHLLGFELINTNEENTRAAGVLGFDVNGQRVLIPCLFLNGRLRAMEIMYLSDTDTFVSATPQWVEYITTRSSGITGEPNAHGDKANSVPSSSLSIFNRPPQIAGKRASVSFDDFTEWCNPDKAVFDPDAKPKLMEVMKSMGKKAYLNFMEDLIKHPTLFEQAVNFYGEDNLKIAFPADPIQKKAGLRKQADLEFITQNDIIESPSEYDMDIKLAAMSDGVAVLDKRAAKNKSEWFADDYSRSFTGLTESGKYNMINARGEFIEIIAAHNPFSITSPETRHETLIFNPKSGVYYKTERDMPVMVRSKRNDTDSYSKWMDGLPKITSAKPNKTYVMVGKHGDMSLPFKVTNRTTANGSVTLSISDCDCCCGFGISISFGMGFSGLGINGHSKPAAEAVRIAGPGCNIKQIGEIVAVGEDWHIWDVTQSEDGGYEEHEKRSEARKALKPASTSVIIDAMKSNGVLNLGLSKRANEYIISLEGDNSPLLKKNACLKVLCADIGLDVDAAKNLMSKVATDSRLNSWVKLADIYNGSSFPSMNQVTGTNEQGVKEEVGMSQVEKIPMNNPEYPDVFDPNLANYDKIKPSDIEFLERAADAGSNSVFDPAMIGVLLKTNRTLIQVDQWVPDLVTALDRLCRTLLLFYWKNPDFAKGYGTDEMSELEDVMLSVIKSMGTIVLFLKQRSAESPGTKIDAFSGN